MDRALAILFSVLSILVGPEEMAVPPEAGALIVAIENTKAGDTHGVSENALYEGAIENPNPLTIIGNRTQVKDVSSIWVEWSEDRLGNHWSDHAAYDLNADGIADTADRPNDGMDQVLWSQPAAKFLLGSPAVQLIRWSQSAFPAVLPPDSRRAHAAIGFFT